LCKFCASAVRAVKKIRFLRCMKRTIPIAHKGITIKVRQEVTSVNGKSYTNYVVHDYTSGRLARHKRSSLEEAKTKAREIAERMASGRGPVLDLRLRDEIHRALESIQPTGMRIDSVCLRFVEAFNILGNADGQAPQTRHPDVVRPQ